jgi:ATP-dependent DNA helicase RecG
MDRSRLQELITKGERLDVEFKSDRRTFSDKEIYEEVVAMANTDGGSILIGVEDDGQVIGAHHRHGTVTDPMKVRSAIFHNTVPNILARVSVVDHPDGEVIAIEVEPYPEVCATAQGKALRRVIGGDGKPASAPFYPRDQRSRRIDLGLFDFTAQPLGHLSFECLDPLEFERLRQTVTQPGGDRSLLDLSNEELAKALRLVETKNGQLVPTIAGLLLLGRESVLRDQLPTHEVHFQVLDDQGNVRVNDTFHFPLIRIIHEIESRFLARNEEQEVLVGLFRVPIPDYSIDAFREAVNNAVLHRDYSRPDAVYIQWYHDHLYITNPGGFMEGITADNILVHEPKPRNPRLAEAFKRIGITEQTGRGVDKIYMGQLRYGRPPPDYHASDGATVRVDLPGGESSLDFAAFVFEQDRNGKSLSLDELLIMNALFFDRRITACATASLIQKNQTAARRVLERLHERGLVEGRGEGRGRVYHLSTSVYRRFHMEAEYVRAKGFEPLQQEQMVIEYVQKHGSIRRSEAADLCRISGSQATRLLRRVARKHPQLEQIGVRRGTRYVWREPEV